MRLTINLATRVYINKKGLNIFVCCAIAVLLFLLYLNAGNISSILGEIGRVEKGIAVLERISGKSKASSVPEKEYKALLGRISFANGIIEKKSYDWLTLLDRLESVVPERVGIVSIDPSARDMQLKLTGVARKFDDLRRFVEKLEDSEFFTDVYLLSQSENRGPEGTRGIDFSIACKAKQR